MLGVGGVEGVGHPVCMTTIYMRVRFAPQVQLDLQSSWSEYKDLPLGFAACLSKNPIIEFLFLIFMAKESLQKLYIYLIELQILILTPAGLQIRLNRGEYWKIVWEFWKLLREFRAKLTE